MAIIKEIQLNNGVTVNYHRVVSVNNITNKLSLVEVASYTDKTKREEEKLKLANEESMNIFIHTEYFTKEYTKDFNVNTAYDYLKTLERFSNCEGDL